MIDDIIFVADETTIADESLTVIEKKSQVWDTCLPTQKSTLSGYNIT